MKNTNLSAFHGYYDTKLVSYLDKVIPSLLFPTTIQDWKLNYQFYANFHPYVAELVQRLIQQSVRGLQAADTEYSTLVKLTSGTSAKYPDGSANGQPVNLVKDELLYLADGITTSLADGTLIKLSGNQVLKIQQVNGQIKSEAIALNANQALILAQNTSAKQQSTGRSIVLNNNTQATLVYGKPTPVLYEEFFQAFYNPVAPSATGENAPKIGVFVDKPHPVKDLDFTSSGAYSVYNWELFFHVPLTVAIHLSQNQRFEEAMQWFHYIFDPTDDSDGPTPERFWKVKPFQYTDVKKIEDILVNLSTGGDSKLKQDTIDSINAWKDSPFRPHLVARYRQTSYMFKTVMAYLDNLIDWGDSLFRQDTGETINEAAQLYILAANILGIRPQAVPKKGSVRPQTYANLKQDLNEFGVAFSKFETDIPFDILPHPNQASESEQAVTLQSMANALYFCVPRNDKLLSYWDTVADRLFKIRNSLNIQGIFRQLALFEPPIDPALLARAVAAGLDIGAVVSGINQPLPLVRFQVLVQKAAEICQEVKSLGNNLLSAIEKEDNEAIALLRASHETTILQMVEMVKYGQWQEAIKAREGLETTLNNAVQRYIYYERQLGRKENEIKIPQLDKLMPPDKTLMQILAEMKDDPQIKEPEVGLRNIDIDIAQDLGGSGGKIVSSHEKNELEASHSARDWQVRASTTATMASLSYYIPTIGLHVRPLGPGASVSFGGQHIGPAFQAISEYQKNLSAQDSYDASHAGKMGSFQRRELDWSFQSNTVAGEITQIFKQLRAAQIREALAYKEWQNHQQQIKNAQEIEQFLKGEETNIGDKKHKKTSTQSFYTWMRREVKGLYGQCFQFAFDVAKKAERALQHELGNPDLSFLQFGYLAGKEGLLAGEKLYLDIKRMEMAYHDLNRREYELTKHVSLLQVNPLELLKLRTTGRCTVTLPEELFDMDCPGHYFRRIKNVAVSIPCVTGPYTSVNCTLTLTKSSIRKSALLGDGYPRVDAEDPRFSDYFGSMQSIVTSSGQNDSGLFETNLRDERYLPFEGSGVVSEWQLQLPANPSNKDPLQFDYDTISDVILHLRYTAREAGGLLRNGAIAYIKDQIDAAQTVGSVRLFSLRHDFPTEWAKFKSVKIGGTITDAELIFDIREEHFPYWSKGRLNAIKQISFFTKNPAGIVPQNPSSSKAEVLTQKPDGTTSKETLDTPKTIALPQPPNKFTLNLKLRFNSNLMDDLWLALTWGKGD